MAAIFPRPYDCAYSFSLPLPSLLRKLPKYENFTSSFGTLREQIAPKSVPHVQHDYFS